eukprot:CAMPEP_0171238628 /NCGR_PEP_ID=MMETSP0790-20130122/43569_1 /TAXON_ID=2925 /ORGANISM="Alexandrium catenella, Strain OF101" /LENGTH=379 /DNA_ID=CAMNT_0011704995 /DNA_START=86 /DNA_END=1223 /DNA_ORIENTATION=-
MSQEEMQTVTIGFGTGELRGSLVSDLVCVGAAPANGAVIRGNCAQSGIVAAWEMSDEPFLSFPFDGILGLGLKPLAVLDDFSFTNQFLGLGNWHSGQFAVLLSPGDAEGDSEISFGGYNPDHLLEPLTWVPLAKPELGHWMVDILNVYVGGTRLDICSDEEPCVAILDTGTSHLAVPAQHLDTFKGILKRPATGLSDCRLAPAPNLTVEMRGWNLTMPPETYMRELPIDPSQLNMQADEGEELACTARLMSVAVPQVGPNMFILGEPALQRYYTVYDAKRLQVGLGLAKQREPKRPDARDVKKEVVRDEASSSSIRATGSHMARGETANAGFWTAHLLVGTPHEGDSWMPCLGFAACLGRPAPVAQAQPLQASLTAEKD